MASLLLPKIADHAKCICMCAPITCLWAGKPFWYTVIGDIDVLRMIIGVVQSSHNTATFLCNPFVVF